MILSDTRELALSSSAAVHAAGADLLIHEATNAWTEEDRRKGLSERDVHRTTKLHGHSTPQVRARVSLTLTLTLTLTPNPNANLRCRVVRVRVRVRARGS